MAASTAYTRSLLRHLYRVASDEGLSLLESLQAFETARVTATASGNQIIQTSANNHSVTFAAPAPGFSQVHLTETADLLLNLYDVVASLSTDADRYAGMLQRLKPARFATFDYQTARP